MMSTVTGEGVTHCSLQVDGKDTQVAAKNISCIDVPKLWDTFPKRDDDVGSSQVSYRGRTYRCSIAKAGDTHTGACLDCNKNGFTFAS